MALCANGIRFPTDFLQQKVEATPNRAVRVEQLRKLVEMRIQADELLGHVAAVGQNHHFRLEAAWVELDPGLGEQPFQAFAQPSPIAVQHFSAAGGDGRPQATR